MLHGTTPFGTSKRDKQAAKRFVRKLLKGCQYVPRVMITGKWASSGYAISSHPVKLTIPHSKASE
jgi:putative transposase